MRAWIAAVAVAMLIPAAAGADTYRHLRHRVHPCVAWIVDRETGGTWSTSATNPSSGAYGLPQAYPAHKMASAGPDWRTNPWTQLRWLVSYVNDRYGGACNAVAFWRQHHWY